MTDSRTRKVVDYHDRTKHHYNRYARSLGYLDWDAQPDPFRRYAGAPLYLLPLVGEDETALYNEVYGGVVAPRALDVSALSRFLEMSLAISAWKAIPGSKWALRCNPSSGNLHPTEGYVLCGPLEGLCKSGGVYHYAALEHGIERRTVVPRDAWRGLAEGFPESTFFVGLSSIFWREAWKYGERAFRYCQHDVGHAIGAIAVAAAGLGWRAVHLDAISDSDVAALLGIDRDADFGEAEREHPDALLAIVAGEGLERAPRGIRDSAIEAVVASDWSGKANRLSSERVEWEVIEEVAAATAKSRSTRADCGYEYGSGEHRGSRISVYSIARQRRSAVAMDGTTSISRDVFYRMMDRTMPRGRLWSALAGRPCIHFAVFVHLVEGLAPGLYCLVRNPDDEAVLRQAFRQQFRWTKPDECPEDLPLYLLDIGDCRRLAAQVSCGQDIAGAGAFSLGMVARFQPALEEEGAWVYRRLYWESGLVGQVLYLEAEAAGVRATGIGCYFDDPVHQVLGIQDHAWQSLYHFTVGGPVDDGRLTTLPPYDPSRLAKHGWTE